MQWGPPVAIALIEQGLGQLRILVDQYLVAGAEITFFRSNPDVPEQLLLVPSLLLLE